MSIDSNKNRRKDWHWTIVFIITALIGGIGFRIAYKAPNNVEGIGVGGISFNIQ